MAADSQWPLQQAVHAKLLADAGLQALIGNPARVYDHVPEASIFPYILVGDATAVDWSTKTGEGMEQTLTLHAWSRYRGLKEVKQVMAAIVTAIDQVTLAVTGHAFVLLRFEFSDTFMDPDGLTRHGVQRFRVLTQAP